MRESVGEDEEPAEDEEGANRANRAFSVFF